MQFLLGFDIGIVVFGIDWQEKHSIHTMSATIKIYLHSLQNRQENLSKAHFFLFLKLVQMTFIFANNVYILSIYFATKT